MVKALKYLKPYWIAVLAVIACVFGQVQCELALPDYMSDIVTYGIQYGGITESMPEAMTEDTMSHMAYFLHDDDYAGLQSHYTKVDVNDPAYTSLYPINQTESIYVLNKDADVHAYEKAYLMTSFGSVKNFV